MAAHTHMLRVSCYFTRRKAQQLLTALYPLRISCPLPHCPCAPPDFPQLKIEVSPNGTNVIKGDSVTMTCQITSSNPEYQSMSWVKDGILLKEQETLHWEQKMVILTLAKVTKEMSGKYHCEARNALGIAKSPDVILLVHCEPPGRRGGQARS